MRLNVRRALAVLALVAAAVGFGSAGAGHVARPEADSVWDYVVVGGTADGSDGPAVAMAMDSIWD